MIHTGAVPFLPPIEGIKDAKYVVTSDGLMAFEELPKKLVIIGGGYIALEFARMFSAYGADVTVLVATGRVLNTKNLGLKHTDLALGERGEILVNAHLETKAKNVYAASDVKGGLPFTYISLDDCRMLTD